MKGCETRERRVKDGFRRQNERVTTEAVLWDSGAQP